MAQTDKYLFDTSFDVEPLPPTPAEDVPEPVVYSEEELAAAQSESFAKGRTDGSESALQGIEQATAQALSAIAAQLEAATAQLAQVNERREQQSLQAAVTILRKLFPELARRNGLDEIEAVIATCLERLHDEPRVVVRTAGTLVDLLRERIDPLAEACGFEGKIVLLSDEALSSSDVRIEWADGGAERDTGRLWDEVDQILAESLGSLSDETDPASDQATSQHTKLEDSVIAEAVNEDPSAEDSIVAEAVANDPSALDNAAADAETAAPNTDDNVVVESVT